MKVYENPRVVAWAVKQILRKMGERDRSGALHASELYQCARKTILARTQPEEYSQDAIMRFAVGFAIQEWVLGPEKDGDEIQHVIFSADRLIKNNVLEFKSTRKPYEALPKDPKTGKGIKGAEKVKFDVTTMDSWIDRTRAYCAAHRVNRAHILVFFIYGDLLSSWTLEFDDEELEATRNEVDRLRDERQRYLDSGELPPVTTRRYDYECGMCPYIAHCSTELKQEGMYA